MKSRVVWQRADRGNAHREVLDGVHAHVTMSCFTELTLRLGAKQAEFTGFSTLMVTIG